MGSPWGAHHRALTLLVRRVARDRSLHHKKILILVDNLALAFSVGKGRSCNHSMLRVTQKLGALAFACNLCLRVRWIPSELNVSDGPSRGSNAPGYQLPSISKEDSSSSKITRGWNEGNQINTEVPSTSKRFEGNEFFGAKYQEAGGRQEEDGKSSKEWGNYVPAVQQHQLRTAGPICSLCPEVQGLVQGERIGVASQRKDGFVSSRLLRCPVPGGKVKPRRREDIGSNGVSFSRVQGPFGTQSESLEGVEKAHSNKEQVASSKIGCLWDSNANDGEEREGYGHHGPSELRCILEAGRSHEPDRKECHSASERSRRAISTLHGGDQRRRRIASRQDRGVQQFHSPRQSSHSQLVGKGSGQSEGDGRRQWWDLPVQVGGLPEAISEKRELARIAKSSCLPTSTWRSLRRLVLKAERPQRGQGKGKMADRHFSAALCQGGKDSKPPISDAKMVDPRLPPFRSDHGEGDDGSGCSYPPLNPLWQPWKDNCLPCALEIFAGCGRLTRSLRCAGSRAFAIDACLNPGDDVLQSEVEYRILAMIFSGVAVFVWIGMPCTSFSVERKDDGLGPGPLRSNERPMGLAGLNKRDQQKVIQGNLLLFFSARIIWACLQCRVPFALENPLSSRCWLTPILVLIKDYYMCCQFLHLDFCQFGESWKKPTGILHAFVNLKALIAFAAERAKSIHHCKVYQLTTSL